MTEVQCIDPIIDVEEEEALVEVDIGTASSSTVVPVENEVLADDSSQEGAAETASASSTTPTTADTATATSSNSVDQYWKKARVAATGGLVTAVGLVLIPAPVPVGAIVTAYGMSILAQEFEGAQAALDNTKHALEGGLEKLAESLHDKEAEQVGEGADASVHQQEEEEEQQQPSETSCPLPEEENPSDPASTEPTAKELSKNDTDTAPAEPELEDILLDEKQTFLEGAGKVWNLHTRNVRKVTRRFITNTMLPALRQVEIEAATAVETAAANPEKVLDIPSVDDNDSIAVPMSTASIASSSDSSSESDNDDVEVVLPVQIASSS